MTQAKLPCRIVRKPEVLNTLGISRTTLFNRINDGLFPPGCSLGGRAVGWLESEIQSILQVFLSGASQDDIKQHVINLVKNRARLGILNHG